MSEQRLRCIVVEAAQVFQRRSVTQLVLVLGVQEEVVNEEASLRCPFLRGQPFPSPH